MKPHEYVDVNGEVLILRNIKPDGTSYKGFVNPTTVGETVEAPDWNPIAECGGGIHGWPLGLGIGDGKQPDYSAIWQVIGVKPEDGLIPLEAKVKFSKGIVRFSGNWKGAFLFIRKQKFAFIQQNAKGKAASSGDSSSAASSGYHSSAAASGNSSSAASSGDSSSAASSGYASIAASSGDSSSAAASGIASLAACVGLDGRVKSGKNGVIVLAYFNKNGERELMCAKVGEGNIKPDTWYRLDMDGNFKEA